eukprot:scaffold1850_cov194-Pinguiococcus_pyrenoidosus.AAC.9
MHRTLAGRISLLDIAHRCEVSVRHMRRWEGCATRKAPRCRCSRADTHDCLVLLRWRANSIVGPEGRDAGCCRAGATEPAQRPGRGPSPAAGRPRTRVSRTRADRRPWPGSGEAPRRLQAPPSSRSRPCSAPDLC